MEKYWLLVGLMIMGKEACSRQKQVAYSSQQWIQYYNQAQINEHWSLGMDGGMRWREWNKYQYIGRVGVGYQFSKVKLAAGIATTGNYTGNVLTKKEFRPYQEVLASWKEKEVLITHRFRLEERFFKSTPIDQPSVTSFNYRFRYQVAVNFPLLRLSREHEYQKISLAVSDEIFINAGKEIVFNYVDQNRLVIGPSAQVSKSLSVALSYMYQFAQKAAPGAIELNTVMWFTIRHNMNFMKSK